MRPANRTWLSATFFFTTLAATIPALAQSRNPRTTYICITDESVADINRQFSLPNGQALNGKCMDDLSKINKRCSENGSNDYWCGVLDVYCKVISQRDAEEDQAAADRKRQSNAQQQQYLQQLQAPMYGDNFIDYSIQQDNITNQALQDIFGRMADLTTAPLGPEPTCQARQIAKKQQQAVPSTHAPAQSLPSPTKDDLKKKPVKRNQSSGTTTSYQAPAYYGSSDPMFAMPPPVDFSSPSPRPRNATQDYLCRSCNEQREFACNKKDEPNMGVVVSSHWAQTCAKNCYIECGY